MIHIIPLKVNKPIRPGDSLPRIIVDAIKDNNIDPSDGDIIAVSLKVVSISRGYIINMDDVKPSNNALKLWEKYGVKPEIAEIVIDMGGEIIGGGDGVIATIYKDTLIGNCGIDQKNIWRGHVVVWPDDPDMEARELRRAIIDELHKRIGIILVDSRVTPLRRGTVGFAAGIAGFNPIREYVGRRDIYGKEIRYTVQNIADDLASLAHLHMGEGDEYTPFIYIKNPPVEISEDSGIDIVKIPKNRCIYMRYVSLPLLK